LKSALAEGMAQLDDCGKALALIDEAIEEIERPGWEERWYYAETLRIKRCLLARTSDLAGAERSYTDPLDWARTQHRRNPGSCAPRPAVPG
jgi:hypothetical protein